MADVTWIVIAEVPGMPQAELLSSMLKAHGVDVALSQEGYAHTLGLTVGPTSLVQVFVDAEKQELAQQIVDEFFASDTEDQTEDNNTDPA